MCVVSMIHDDWNKRNPAFLEWTAPPLLATREELAKWLEIDVSSL